MRRLCFAAVAVLALVAVGCGDRPRSRVHGVVKLDGKPLTGGTVIFLTSDNMTTVADIQPNGTYAVEGVARGPVKVSVQQPPPRPTPRPNPGAGGKPNDVSAGDDAVRKRGGEEPAPPPAAAGPRLPAKYTDPAQSGLAFELADGDSLYNIDLKK